MNPLDYRYNSDDNLKFLFDKYYVYHIDGIESHSEFMGDVKLLYETGV